MKSKKSDPQICRQMHDRAEVPIRVVGQSYREFAQWMDRESARLVTRWVHKSAPKALEMPLFRSRLSQSK